MKVAIITDMHFGARGDHVHFLDYFDKFYTNSFFPTLEKEGIDTIIEMGDIFDRRKYINYYSLYRAKEMFFDVLEEKNLMMHSIVGNHTTYYKSTNRVNSMDILFDRHPCITNYEEVTKVNFGGLDILFIPWINDENRESSIEKIQSSKCKVGMGHLELQGFEMYRGSPCHHGMNHALFRNFDMVFSGHYHHKSSRDNIHYLGSPYEMTWSDYNDPRGFHIFDTETRELTYIQNPYTMFTKLFYDDNENLLKESYDHIKDQYVKIIVTKKENPYLFDLYIDHVSNHDPYQLQVVEDHQNKELLDDDIVDETEDVLTIMKKYVKNYEDPSLESLMSELYYEALSTE